MKASRQAARQGWIVSMGALLATALLLLGGCTPGLSVAPGSVVDGWRIGQPVTCTDFDSDSACAEYIPTAIAGLESRNPGHLPIAEIALYGHGDPFGNTVLMTCSGGCSILAVAVLVDGSVLAIAVGTPGVSTHPHTFDYGPEAAR